jgi:hypothetical protein
MREVRNIIYRRSRALPVRWARSGELQRLLRVLLVLAERREKPGVLVRATEQIQVSLSYWCI